MTVTNLHISMTPFRNESRVLKETESIVAAGIADEVCILALHEEGLQETEQIDSARQVIRLRLRTRSLPKNVPSQAIKYLELAWRAVKIARAKRPAIHNVHSVALMPIGVVLKWLCGSKLVYDAHELETETNGLKGFRKRAAKWVERATIGFADLVIVVGPGIESWYRQHYKDLPIVTVLNAPRYARVERSSLLRENLGIPDGLRIALYQGALAPGRGVRELLDAAPRLEDAGYAVVFMGYGPMQAEVEEAARRHANVYFHAAVPPSDVLEHTASADVGIASTRDGSLNHRLCLPNKFFEYIVAGIPAIATALPEMERIMTDEGIGVCLSDWSADAVVEALKAIDAMRGAELSTRLHRAAEKYCWEKQETVMIDAYRRLLQ